MNPVKLENLFNHFNDSDWWASEEGINALLVEATMEKPICSQYWDPKEHLKLMANTWKIESAIVYGAYASKLEFRDPADHMYIHIGKGYNKADCRTIREHKPVEIKSFINNEGFNRWLNKDVTTFDRDHGCELYLCYIKVTKKLYIVSGDKTECVLAKNQININLL